MAEADPSGLVQCPYVPSHQLLRGTRFQSHLRKCRANTLKDKFSPFHAKALEIVVCEFDTSHHVHKSEYQRHVEEDCPAAHDAIMFQTKRREAEAQPETLQPSWKVHADAIAAKGAALQIGNADDYDEGNEESDRPGGYDPIANMMASKHGAAMYNFQNVTQSEKRQLRQTVRLAAATSDDATEELQAGFRNVQAGRFRNDNRPGQTSLASPGAAAARGRGSGAPGHPPQQRAGAAGGGRGRGSRRAVEVAPVPTTVERPPTADSYKAAARNDNHQMPDLSGLSIDGGRNLNISTPGSGTGRGGSAW